MFKVAILHESIAGGSGISPVCVTGQFECMALALPGSRTGYRRATVETQTLGDAMTFFRSGTLTRKGNRERSLAEAVL
jgi:hypothetical protein